MPELFRQDTPTFNLLSLGERGVGKTVFLIGSYAEFSSQISQEASPAWWLECQESEDRKNLESILNYIEREGEYPPPTMKIAEFDFSIKCRDRWGTRTVCHFRWWDIPGEYCNFQQPEFQQMVLESHSCCIFIDAYRVIDDPNYLSRIDSLINQVMAIADLVDFEIFPYGFALILTKCDRLDSGLIGRLQVEEKLHILITSLEAVSARYRRFYTAIPVINSGGRFSLQPTGAAEAFIWLASELEKNHKSHTNLTLGAALNSTTASATTTKTSKFLWFFLLAIFCLLGWSIAFWFAFIYPNYKTTVPQIPTREQQQ
jgi:hypothetical protein